MADYIELREFTQVTIADGTSLSAEIDLRGFTPIGISIPATWTAASLTFQIYDGTAWVDLHIFGSEYQEAVDVSGGAIAIALDPQAAWLAHLLKIRSGTSGTPVNQGGDKVLTVIKRPF